MSEAVVSDPLVAPERSRAEQVVRGILRVSEAPRRRASVESAHRIFSVSMVISGIRCLISYIVLPFLAPALGAATGAEPYFGIPISVIALIFDVRGIRRFWLADHRYRWEISVIYVLVMGLVTSLLITDCIRLAHR